MQERRIEPLEFNGETIYIEVVEAGLDASNGYEDTSAADKLAKAGEQVRITISALATTVHAALDAVKPDEWAIEINLGFKGKAGIPFLSEGEANGAIKVTAKWKRS